MAELVADRSNGEYSLASWAAAQRAGAKFNSGDLLRHLERRKERIAELIAAEEYGRQADQKLTEALILLREGLRLAHRAGWRLTKRDKWG
jgi:hypothetical protein